MEAKLYGGIEFGGTKTICAIGDGQGAMIAQVTFPTASVDETTSAISDFFRQNASVAALGVGSFGPLDLAIRSEKFGYIMDTPKRGWSNVNLKGLLEERIKVPVTLNTDVNCAALGEYYFGVAKQNDNFIYLTVGTGIGGSVILGGTPLQGLSHSEIGHMLIPHEPFDDSFKGSCAFHGDCLEGIASGSAMANRWGQETLGVTEEKVWRLEAGYLAAALHNLILSVSPGMIVIGGGLVKRPGLLEAIRQDVVQSINGYVGIPDIETYIVQSSGEMNGVLGAIKLASLAQ